MNDKTTFFVDNASRIDTAPESVLYDALGNKVMDLEKTDVSRAARGRLQVSRSRSR